MAVKHFCDRCNWEVQNNAYTLHRVTVNPSKSFVTAELCTSCRDSLLVWLSTPPPQAASIPRASQK